MKRTVWTRYLLLAVALSSLLAALAAADAHDHGKSAPHTLELNAGRKWGTDDALRQGLSAIHASVSQTLPAAHSGKAKVADYDAFGKALTAQITYIVENCKLDSKADAQLHIIVADIMSGVEAAEGKEGRKKSALRASSKWLRPRMLTVNTSIMPTGRPLTCHTEGQIAIERVPELTFPARWTS